MHFIRHLTNREKIILSFLVILILLNGLTILVSRNLGEFSQSFKSMLEDRLIPSLDLAKIQEEFYQNRLTLLETLVLLQKDPQWIQEIEKNNGDIDHIILKFSKTYLTAEEAEVLDQFKRQIQEYRVLEQKIINFVENDSLEAALEIYLNQSMPAFGDLLSTMRDLEDIQLVVGEELYHEADQMVRIIQMMGYLSIAIALMITLNMLKVLHFKVK